MITAKATLTSHTSLRASRHHIPAYGLLPNTSLQNQPLLIYLEAFTNASASAVEAHLKETGVVSPPWRCTMYSTTHFHSTTHEVLCVVNGKAKLCFGGEHNEGRIEPVVGTGDVIIVPAGVGHRLLNDLAGGFQMVGSYPTGHNWDMCFGSEGEEDKVHGIRKVDWFVRDPIYGKDGPSLSQCESSRLTMKELMTFTELVDSKVVGR